MLVWYAGGTPWLRCCSTERGRGPRAVGALLLSWCTARWINGDESERAPAGATPLRISISGWRRAGEFAHNDGYRFRWLGVSICAKRGSGEARDNTVCSACLPLTIMKIKVSQCTSLIVSNIRIAPGKLTEYDWIDNRASCVCKQQLCSSKSSD